MGVVAMVFEGRFIKTEYQLSVFNRDALKMPKMLSAIMLQDLNFALNIGD